MGMLVAMGRTTRMKIGLECTICGHRNYSLVKKKGTMPGKLVLRKHCPHCNRHTEHRESK
jgi:large subunit ribosomal protein L33